MSDCIGAGFAAVCLLHNLGASMGSCRGDASARTVTARALRHGPALVAALLVCVPGALSRASQDADDDRLDRDYAEELPRIAPLSTTQALERFSLAPGFSIELAAREPRVVDPVSMAFDAEGALFVVEMRGYSEQRDAAAGRIRRLVDGDGDGTFEKSTVFAEGLRWPTAIACYDGGVFVGAAPDILFLADTDRDGRADRREVVFTGFGIGNVQGLLNSFRWGLDCRIHGVTSSSGASVLPAADPRAKPLRLRGRDFSFDPRTRSIRAESGGGQHGACFDDEGRRFVCSNSDHAQQILFADADVARNPFLRAPSARISIAADGPQADVFRTSPVEPWRLVRTRLRVKGLIPGPVERGGLSSGYFTSATGITVYRGDAWPATFSGALFVGDVGGNLLHRKELVADGLVFSARRAEEQSEFLTSSDPWFRPVQCANGPDGNLYVADMYREVIEHPDSLAPLIKRHLDLTSGDDRGRIWRIVHTDGARRRVPRLAGAPSEQLVGLLAHPNAWHRETAARLLFERADPDVSPALERQVRTAADHRGRVHALHLLARLDGLTPALLLDALADADGRVRAQAVRLAAPLAARSPSLRDHLLGMTADADLRTRYGLAFTLGELTDPARLAALAALVRSDGTDRWMRLAVASSVAEGAGILLDLLDEGDDDAHAPMLAELSRIRLAAGRGPSSPADLAALLATARERAADPHLAPRSRCDAIGILSLGGSAEALETLGPLVDPRQPLQVQLASIETLARLGGAAAGEVLVDAVPTAGPTTRLECLAALLSRPEWVNALLDALAAGTVRAEWLDAGHARSLRSHDSAAVRERAAKLLARAPSADRSRVLALRQPALDLAGDGKRGGQVFVEKCATCHRHRGQGVDVGPQLSTALHRGAQAILADVIDPNREVDPRYQDYLLRLTDGRSLTGIITAESAVAITLVRSGGATQTILRRDIDQIHPSGLSLMPEGLEADLDDQALADLMAYLLEE
ncbi:MAG: c-type cytochrome [Planctomycetota bacterium]|nr:c-type cytochrome [Planctomycetota bacterium]MDP6989681.1 c-type cytochrome [Planctomycetota bacterium]